VRCLNRRVSVQALLKKAKVGQQLEHFRKGDGRHFRLHLVTEMRHNFSGEICRTRHSKPDLAREEGDMKK
jgi:hypothetical protein